MPGDIAYRDSRDGDVASGGPDRDRLQVAVGPSTIDVAEGMVTGAVTATFGGFEVFIGTIDDDTLIGGDGDDSLRGGRGDDTIMGNGGDDELRGNRGDDTLDGGPGSDSLAAATTPTPVSTVKPSSTASDRRVVCGTCSRAVNRGRGPGSRHACHRLEPQRSRRFDRYDHCVGKAPTV